MNIHTDLSVSMTDAAQDFAGAARLADQNGSVVIVKNGRPRYIMMEYSAAREEETAPAEEIMSISRQLLQKNREAYEVLAR